MNSKLTEEPRQKYIQNPPEEITATLAKNMTDSDLLDMHYFLIEDGDLDNEFEEGFYIDLFQLPSVLYPRLPAGYINRNPTKIELSLSTRKRREK